MGDVEEVAPRHPGGGRSAHAGRRYLVGGASRGLGLACARALVDAGARVALTARGAEELREAAEELGDVSEA